ncbi:MAG: DUF2752 domain-containing protein [Lachnospiraceae bacterium]|nr:DUF2752 domain-containing protein [Lachnospiraceae bacterium]
MWSRKIGEEDKALFPAACIFTGAAALMWLFAELFPAAVEWLRWKIPCPIQALTGLYCPGCGGQRAVKAMLHGELLTSLYYHPAILPAALYLIVYLASQGLNRLSKSKIPALCFKSWHLYVFLGLLVLQWIVKNVLHFLGQYTI